MCKNVCVRASTTSMCMCVHPHSHTHTAAWRATTLLHTHWQTQVEGGGPTGKQESSSTLPIIIKLVCPHERSGSVIGKVGVYPSVVSVSVLWCVGGGLQRERESFERSDCTCLHTHNTQGGEVVKAIRSETGSRVKVEDTVPGLKERAITVSAADK